MFSLYKIDYLLHDSHQERRTFNTLLVLEKIVFYFQHMHCKCRFYQILRIDYEFLDAFVVKSDILELLNNTFVFNTCNGHFYQNLRINYEFRDAFVVKSDILELLKKNWFCIKVTFGR